MLTTRELAEHMGPGTHASTFGGNSVACAAAIAVLEAIEEEQMLANCRKVGAYLEDSLQELKERHPCLQEVRGMGLMRAVVLDRPARPVVLQALERGVILDSAGERALRLLPPLTIGQKEVDRLCSLLDELLAKEA
jgi:acetylornithine/succinyldiaminopimelate/putrescine aminotransferase